VAKVVLQGELLCFHVNSCFTCNLQFDISAVWGGSCVGWTSHCDISKERSAFVFGVKQSNKIHFDVITSLVSLVYWGFRCEKVTSHG
jgi:hypothetical protein